MVARVAGVGGAVVWGGGTIGFAEKAEPRACAVLWSHQIAERNCQGIRMGKKQRNCQIFFF
jgi:hypothetical protein